MDIDDTYRKEGMNTVLKQFNERFDDYNSRNSNTLSENVRSGMRALRMSADTVVARTCLCVHWIERTEETKVCSLLREDFARTLHVFIRDVRTSEGFGVVEWDTTELHHRDIHFGVVH